jgi:site-specific DNA recombinase
MRPTDGPRTLPVVRCAVYTRKSTEDGLEQQFNSLDAQREAAQAYVQALQHEGWACLPDRYDDGGFTGGNMERPALRRLLSDVEDGKVDAVICYKIDRLSRSLLDFTRLMELFERHKVALVSITQKLDTSSSMGRLVLNVLMSFAEFERAIISERTRDKIAATRRKGKWCGGYPVLGYDVDARGGRLLVNEDEAVRVRAIFELYLEHGSLLPTVQELERRGWAGKRWVTGGGRERGGEPFTRTSLHRLLTNVAYLGKTRYKSEVHAGEHPPLVDASVFAQVQALLKRNATTGGSEVRNAFGFVLKSLLRCVPCGCAMTPTHTGRNGKKYRYYVCSRATKLGRKTCPSPSVPAGEIERFVVDRIRSIGTDPQLKDEVFARAVEQDEARMAELEAERRSLEKDLARWNAQLGAHARGGRGQEPDGAALAYAAELEERAAAASRQLVRVREQTHALRRSRLTEEDVASVLGQFGPVWEALTPDEQGRLVRLLVEKVEYDGKAGNVAITFHPPGIKTLADELAEQQQQQQQHQSGAKERRA